MYALLKSILFSFRRFNFIKKSIVLHLMSCNLFKRSWQHRIPLSLRAGCVQSAARQTFHCATAARTHSLLSCACAFGCLGPFLLDQTSPVHKFLSVTCPGRTHLVTGDVNPPLSKIIPNCFLFILVKFTHPSRCIRNASDPHPLQHLTPADFFTSANQAGVKLCLPLWSPFALCWSLKRFSVFISLSYVPHYLIFLKGVASHLVLPNKWA